MSAIGIYRLRLKRKRKILRAIRKKREMTEIINRAGQVEPDDILCFSTVRNEKARLPYFLKYYRNLGVSHFFFVDNGSDDGGVDYLKKQDDVSVWSTSKSYKRAGFGADWLNALKARYARNHWVLIVDVDEFFVYPFCDTRPLRALTDWLDDSSLRSFGAILLDMYAKGSIEEAEYREGQDPIKVLPYFDSGNYFIRRNKLYQNLWIQGGPRQRVFFSHKPEFAPALNKTPLVKWGRGMAFVSSTHSLLPRGLNQTYDEWGGEKASGCLLHTKFLNLFKEKAKEELERKQHYAASREYKLYEQSIKQSLNFWTEESSRYQGWQQLEELGLMSRGNWA